MAKVVNFIENIIDVMAIISMMIGVYYIDSQIFFIFIRISKILLKASDL